MIKSKNIVVGVDVGGTYTDVFFLDKENNHYEVAKVPTTPKDQSKGFLNGLRSGTTKISDIETLVHGSTVATNALLERKGSLTGLITTQGFRDVLEMRRRDRPNTWGLWSHFLPIIQRAHSIEVAERTLSDGTIRQKVNEDQIRSAAKNLLSLGIKSVCIFFINSYANPENERLALKIIRQVWPNDFVNASSDILPEIREFERASTTALNAYVQPLMANYIGKLEKALTKNSWKSELFIVQSSGGIMTTNMAKSFPIKTALSGPAAGVIAGAYIAKRAGYPNVITCDMGGTSFDVSLVSGSGNRLSSQAAIDFGLVIRTPMIDITTIGAGGGSIAWVDRSGILQVGPDSAGSEPGPACYGLGNKFPTVTDANVLLGRIDARKPIGGKLGKLSLEFAEKAIYEHIGSKLDLDPLRAAEAIIAIANSRMAGAIRLVSIEKGFDPRNFVTMPFGGGGGLHAGALVKEVGLAKALIPRLPGITSAIGCIIADMRHDNVHTVNSFLEQLNWQTIEKEMIDSAEFGLDLLKRSGGQFLEQLCQFEFDMLYQGQTHAVNVPLPIEYNPAGIKLTKQIVQTAFDKAYETTYGRLLNGIPIKVLNLRSNVVGVRPKFDLTLLTGNEKQTVGSAKIGVRPIWHSNKWHETPIYNRLAIPLGSIVDGPAILEQSDTTIFIDPGMYGSVDEFGNLIISRLDATHDTQR